MKSGNLNFLEPSGPLQACKGTALPFRFLQTKLRGVFRLEIALCHCLLGLEFSYPIV